MKWIKLKLIRPCYIYESSTHVSFGSSESITDELSIDQPTVIKNFHIFRSFLSCWILSVQTLDFSVFICYFPKTNIREPKVM